MENEYTDVEIETLNGGDLVYRAADLEQTSVREGEDGSHLLEGRMMPYGEWTEVNSVIEGHFMERFLPGSLTKTMQERASRIRALFQHGRDFLGRQPIASGITFEDRDDGAYYGATLFRSVPELIVEGLRHGVYGSSIQYKPLKYDRVMRPRRSEHNPEGIPEITVREAYVKEVSVVTFPQYDGATASVRSVTDEIAAWQLLGDPAKLLEVIARQQTEPPHSESGEPAKQAPVVSRSTQSSHDYLTTQEGAPPWRL